MNMVTNIALVAHDSRKQELLDWVRYNAGSLKHSHLFCTGTTGRLVSETLTEKLGPEAPSGCTGTRDVSDPSHRSDDPA